MRSVLVFGAVLAALVLGYAAGSAKISTAGVSSTAVVAQKPIHEANDVKAPDAAEPVMLAETSGTEEKAADPTSAGDDESPTPRKAVGVCVTCHGLDGIAKIPIAPHLAGESRVYIETQLKAFRNGKRVHEMMTVIAEDMSDADISAAATWYSAIKIHAEMPDSE